MLLCQNSLSRRKKAGEVPDNADLIEMFGIDLDRLILVAHKQGMSYPLILSAILERLSEMVLQCSHEQWLGKED